MNKTKIARDFKWFINMMILQAPMYQKERRYNPDLVQIV